MVHWRGQILFWIMRKWQYFQINCVCLCVCNCVTIPPPHCQVLRTDSLPLSPLLLSPSPSCSHSPWHKYPPTPVHCPLSHRTVKALYSLFQYLKLLIAMNYKVYNHFTLWKLSGTRSSDLPKVFCHPEEYCLLHCITCWKLTVKVLHCVKSQSPRRKNSW